MIHIDGSILEGGGQILRNTISLGCLTKHEVHVDNIRGKRSKPGLRPQHLHGLQLIGKICDAEISGDFEESTSVYFKPRKIKGGNYESDTKTAGSTSLLMQIAVPCLCLADSPSLLILKGGTDAEMAPPIDYYMSVFLPVSKMFGLDIKCKLICRGFYPQGKGEISVTVNPVKELLPINLTDFGEIKTITGKCFVAGNLPIKIAHKMASAATEYIANSTGITPIIKSFREDESKAFGTGSGIIIIAETTTNCILAGTGIGKRGRPADEVGVDAARMLCEDLKHKVCVDHYMQDQLIIFMALATGSSQIRVGPLTLHTRSAIYITETFTRAKFTIEQVSETNNIIKCDGRGIQKST